MARYAVSVDSPTKRVKLHLERKKPCGELFKKIKGKANPIEVLDDNTVKIGKTDEWFWLFVWVPSVDSDQVKALVAQNKYVKDAEINIGAKLDLCEHCM